MKLKQCLIIIGTLWPIAAFSAGDAFYTGNRLYDYCEKRPESCTDYIAGVVDTLMLMNVATQTKWICPPDNVVLGQMVDVTVNYLHAHPEKRQSQCGEHGLCSSNKGIPLQ